MEPLESLQATDFFKFIFSSESSQQENGEACVSVHTQLYWSTLIFLTGRGKTLSGSSRIECSGERCALKPHKPKLYVMMSA